MFVLLFSHQKLFNFLDVNNMKRLKNICSKQKYFKFTYMLKEKEKNMIFIYINIIFCIQFIKKVIGS